MTIGIMISQSHVAGGLGSAAGFWEAWLQADVVQHMDMLREPKATTEGFSPTSTYRVLQYESYVSGGG